MSEIAEPPFRPSVTPRRPRRAGVARALARTRKTAQVAQSHKHPKRPQPAKQRLPTAATLPDRRRPREPTAVATRQRLWLRATSVLRSVTVAPSTSRRHLGTVTVAVSPSRCRPPGSETIPLERLLAAEEEVDRVRRHPGDEAGESLVADLAEFRSTLTLAEDDPADVNVARSWDTEFLRLRSYPPADLGDRDRLVVEPPDRPQESPVVSRRGLNHLGIVPDRTQRLCANFVPTLRPL